MKRILIVDDDPEIVAFLENVLSHAKYQVLSALNGKMGFKLAREARPDLVILDLMMPDMHGFQVCEALRKEEELKAVKIIVSSGKQYQTDRRAAERLGADMFLPKPYSIQTLLDAVTSLVGTP